ncbi:MAG: CinA family nicotinamide mononucleotide deamidase-related protein [Bacteroidota bacterium]
MKVDLISIGDELLIGQTINTNVAWLGQQLTAIGARIMFATTIPDDAEAIMHAIDISVKRSDVVIITGGLGPTKDDITKATLCRYFDSELQLHEPSFKKIENYFKQRNLPMLEVNIQQAMLPSKCEVLSNNFGTAAGMWFDSDGKVVISLPGVPYEMKGIFEEEIVHRIRERFELKSMYHATILVQGIGESFLADRIAAWEEKVRSVGLSLAYLPSPGLVKLRLTSFEGESRATEIEGYFDELRAQMPHYVFGKEHDTLPSVLAQLLKEKKLSIGTVESCTAGAIASSLISIAGASSFYKGSFLSYTEELKEKVVGVPIEIINNFGVVSKEVAESMASNGAQKLGLDLCISTTGYVGPDGGDEFNSVGTTWVGIAYKGKVFSKKFIFGINRERNIQATVLSALNLARCIILNISIEKK